MEGDYDDYDGYPSRYDQYDHNPHVGQVFHEDSTQGRKRGPDVREAPKGGGEFNGKTKENITCQGVFNLSNKVLSKEEKMTLDKGLTFVPPKKLDKFNTFY